MLILFFSYMTSIVEGDWRKVSLINCIPVIVLILGNLIVLEESARYLFVNGKYEQAIKIINKMGF